MRENLNAKYRLQKVKLLTAILYITVVSVVTVRLSLNNYYILPTSCVRVFDIIPAKSNGTKWLAIITERLRVFCEESIKLVCIS
jgi:hypothetical protein